MRQKRFIGENPLLMVGGFIQRIQTVVTGSPPPHTIVAALESDHIAPE